MQFMILIAAFPISLKAETVDNLAAVADDSKIKLNAFGTLGVARSTSDQAEFVRDLSQPNGVSTNWASKIDNILGVQASWQPSSEFEMFTQVVSRYQYNGSRTPELTWAFAKWEPASLLDLRVGRLGADFLIGADSRLVGHSYLEVRPMPNYFGPLFFSYFDGVDATSSLNVGDNIIRTKIYGGLTREKSTVAGQVWDANGSNLYGVVLDYLAGPWQFRASTAQIRLSNDLPIGALTNGLRAAGTALGIPAATSAALAISTGGTTSKFTTVGAEYNEGALKVSGMLNTISHQSSAFQDSRAAYLLAGYRVDKVTPFAAYSRWSSTAKNISTGLPNLTPGLIALNQGYDQVLRDSGCDQTTYTLGARWDILENVGIKFQWDAVRGSPRSLFPVRGEKPGWNGRTDVFTMTVDFVL
ncbi:MAG: hypothetical protein WCK93_10115 [Nitrosomonadales bacterium]